MELKEFKIAVLPLRNRLVGYAARLTEDGNDAEDVVQEVMLKLWNIRNKLDEYQSIEALAMKMTYNLCIDLWRKKRTSSVPVDQISEFQTETPERIMESRSEIELMKRIIESLPALQQTIIRMKDVEEFETEEIAQITGCNPAAIRSNLSRARKKVRDIYLQCIQEKKRRKEA